MLWLKALHIIFVVTWFAGLFYLPRVFVYHAMESNPQTIARFKVMERRLMGITHIGGALALVFGLAVMGWWISNVPGYMKMSGWLHTKLLLVLFLVAYHVYCAILVKRFAADKNQRSDRWFRWFNEVPALLLVAIVLLVVVKPW